MPPTTIQMPGGVAVGEAEVLADFRNGFIFELVDSRANAPLAVHVMVLNPQKYELTEPHQSTLTPTAGNTVVDESTGIVQGSLTLEGTFGIRSRSAVGFEGVQGGGAALSGSAHFRDLRDMFREYSALKQSPATAAYTRLLFHALRDDDHFILAQPTFTSPRDAKLNRIHHLYRIQAATIGNAEELSQLRRVQVAGDDMIFLEEAIKTINQAFNDARSHFAEVNKGIGEIRRKIANINTVMVNAAQLINAVGSALANGADTFISYPFRLGVTAVTAVADAADSLAESVLDSTNGIIADSARSLRRLEDALSRILSFPEKFEAASGAKLFRPYFGGLFLTAQDMADGTAGATVGSATRVRSGSESGASVSEANGVQTVKLTATDTLEGLATRFDTDATLIIVANDLTPPYIHPGGGPGLLAPGDNILIPVRDATSGGSSGSGAEYLTVEDALYGVDMALDLDRLNREGVLDFRDPVGSLAGDVGLSRGLANVVQGTAITLWTERGTMQYLPDVGITRNAGRKGTIQHVMLAALNIRSAILSDSRISGIAESSIVLDGDVLTQEITPIVSGGRGNTKLILPFGKTSGGS